MAVKLLDRTTKITTVIAFTTTRIAFKCSEIPKTTIRSKPGLPMRTAVVNYFFDVGLKIAITPRDHYDSHLTAATVLQKPT